MPLTDKQVADAVAKWHSKRRRRDLPEWDSVRAYTQKYFELPGWIPSLDPFDRNTLFVRVVTILNRRRGEKASRTRSKTRKRQIESEELRLEKERQGELDL